MFKKAAGLVLLLTLFTISTVVMARTSRESTAADVGQPLNEPGTGILDEIRRFASVQISVQDAIRIAEEHAIGAKAVDVSFDGEADRLTYRGKTYRRDEIWEGAVDASTGKIVGEELVTPVSALDPKDKIELAGFRAAGIDLSDVVPVAEIYGSGEAVSAGLEEEDGRLIFLVVLVADGSLKQISVNPNQN